MLSLGLASPPALAETRALLTGVWQFDSQIIPNLKGPENDLAAMEALVRAEGANDVTVLRNDQVTRTSLETALHALGLRAKPGDWILFYYSGHGAQAEAAVKGTRDGDLDQFLPLAGFDPDHQDTERFVLDKDIYSWMARYIPPSVRVLMIADTCHSGTLNRSIDPRAFHFTPRLAFRGDASAFKLIPRPAPRFPGVLASADSATGTGGDWTAPLDRPDLANVIYIAAAQDDQLALEASLPVEGAPARGLLTYSFEQGLTTTGPNGKTLAADLDHDGKVSVSEIGAYLNSQVRALTGQRQETVMFYTSDKANLPLFATAPAVAPMLAQPRLPAVFSLNSASDLLLGGTNVPWRKAADQASADFVWDYDKATVLRRSGDVVAQQVKTVSTLRGVVEKWNAVEALRPLIDEAHFQVVIGPRPNGTRYAAGAHVTLRIALKPGAAYRAAYLTIFNLASDGTLQTLYPKPEDGDGMIAEKAVLPVIENEVVPPFGVDHVIAVVTPDNAATFRSLLRASENQRAAGRLVPLITSLLAAAGPNGALSIGELYTGD
jgi:hypothetical protein